MNHERPLYEQMRTESWQSYVEHEEEMERRQLHIDKLNEHACTSGSLVPDSSGKGGETCHSLKSLSR